MMYRYFLHTLADWPVDGACNDEPFGPDASARYIVTVDATDPICAAYAGVWPELSAADARQWAAALPGIESQP